MTDTTDKPTLKDIADKDKSAPDATASQEEAGGPRKSGGGFVWFVLILVIMGGAVAAGWPYIGPRVEPLLSDARGLLGLNPRPTQARLPSTAPPVSAPEPAPVVVEAPTPEPMPEPAPEPMLESTPEPISEPIFEPTPEPAPVVVPNFDAIGADAQAALAATAELTQALNAIKDELATMSDRLQALEDGARADPTAPAQALVLGVTQLRARLTGDSPFAAELTALEHIGAGDMVVMDALQRLKPHAEVGIPSEAALTARFTKVAKAVITARSTSEAGGWLAAVKDGLGGLVTVRRTDPARISDEVERAVAVAEAALELGELGEAVKALSVLQGAASDAAAAWLGDASARVDAEAALEDLHSHALAVLSSAGGA